MTELEKAKNNQFDDIDFGKLIEEAKAEIEKNSVKLNQNASAGYDKFREETTEEILLAPALITIWASNAIFNHFGISDHTAPLFVAGISTLGKIMDGTLNKRKHEIACDVHDILTDRFSAISFTYRKKEEK